MSRPTRQNQPIPSLRRHKPTRQGVVTLSGKDHYLGTWPDGLDEPPLPVRELYDRRVAEWLAGGRLPLDPGGLQRERQASRAAGERLDRDEGPSIAEVVVAFIRHAEVYYCHPNGEPTGEADNFKAALRPLAHLYSALPARRMRQKRLKAVRKLMVRGYEHPRYGTMRPLSRGQVNARISRIVRMFRWAAEEELVPSGVWQRLKTVRSLSPGRTDARETDPVLPVEIAHVEAALAHVRPPVHAAIRVQLLTGMRPGETLRLCLAEIDRSAPVWLYRPGRHKTAHRKKARTIAIGPRAQAVLLEMVRIRCAYCGIEGRPPRIASRDNALCGPCADRHDRQDVCGPWKRLEVTPADEVLFSPRRDHEERMADLRSRRKTRVQPSQKNRKKAGASRRPGEAYTSNNYTNAIRRACKVAGVPAWHANQLRHTRATEIRALHGIEAAANVLGHARADVTQIYAERDAEAAARIAAELG